jgi:hypothetical protein
MPAAIKTLEDAIGHWRFSASIEKVKDAVPEVLFLGGENPLRLLHKALSGDIHNGTDEDCLKSACDVRTVLVAFAERLSEVLKNEQELTESIGRLKVKA